MGKADPWSASLEKEELTAKKGCEDMGEIGMKKKFLITIDTEGDNLWAWKQGDAIRTENVLYSGFRICVIGSTSSRYG